MIGRSGIARRSEGGGTPVASAATSSAPVSPTRVGDVDPRCVAPAEPREPECGSAGEAAVDVDLTGSWLDGLQEPELGPASWLSELPASARLMSELEALPADVIADDYDAVEVVAHWHRLEAHCAAMKRVTAAALARRVGLARGLAGLERLGIAVGDPNTAADELALRLGVSRRAAVGLIRSGRAFDAAAIPTGEALVAGEIDAVKADLLVDAVQDLSPEAALEVQARVLPVAVHRPAPAVRRELAKACAEVDPEEFEDRCTRAAEHRRVDRPRVLPHGMASLYAVMPAVAATRLYRAVDAAARSAASDGDPRTMDQLRADALALMGSAAIETGWIGGVPDDPDGSNRVAPSSSHPGSSPGECGAAVNSTAPGARSPQSDPRRPRSARGRPPDGDPAAGREERHERLRVGVIGGRSAQVRVVIPLTVLMDGVADDGSFLPEIVADARTRRPLDPGAGDGTESPMASGGSRGIEGMVPVAPRDQEIDGGRAPAGRIPKVDGVRTAVLRVQDVDGVRTVAPGIQGGATLAASRDLPDLPDRHDPDRHGTEGSVRSRGVDAGGSFPSGGVDGGGPVPSDGAGVMDPVSFERGAGRHPSAGPKAGSGSPVWVFPGSRRQRSSRDTARFRLRWPGPWPRVARGGGWWSIRCPATSASSARRRTVLPQRWPISSVRARRGVSVRGAASARTHATCTTASPGRRE